VPCQLSISWPFKFSFASWVLSRSTYNQGKFSLPPLNAAVCASSQLMSRDAYVSVDVLRNRTVCDPKVTLLT